MAQIVMTIPPVQFVIMASLLIVPVRLRADHQEAELHHRLALEDARRRDWGGAFREIGRALDIEPRNPLYLYNLGLFHYNNQEYEKALPWLRSAHQIRPEEFEFHRALASALESFGELGEAEREFTALVQQHANEPSGYCGRAAIRLRRGEMEQARADVDRAIALDERTAEAWYLLGKIREQEQEFKNAVRAYLRVIEIEPRHLNTHYRLGILYKRFGQNEDARRHADIYQSLKSRIDRANSILFGTRSLSSGDYVSADEQFSRVLASDPDNVEALYYLGVVRQRQSRPAEAVNIFERALSINPKLAIVHANLGLTLASMHLQDRAFPHLARALELAPADFSVSLIAGRGYLALNQFGPAETALLRSLELSPSEPSALAELFQLYALWDKAGIARRYATLAAEANPSDALLQYRAGLFWAAEREFGRAKAALEKAAALAPQDEKIRQSLAEISRVP